MKRHLSLFPFTKPRAFTVILTCLLSGLTLYSLSGCTTRQTVNHPGLAADGYGFVKNGPRLAPPEHLLKAASFRTK